jgi:hypothetical protein
VIWKDDIHGQSNWPGRVDVAIWNCPQLRSLVLKSSYGSHGYDKFETDKSLVWPATLSKLPTPSHHGNAMLFCVASDHGVSPTHV